MTRFGANLGDFAALGGRLCPSCSPHLVEGGKNFLDGFKPRAVFTVPDAPQSPLGHLRFPSDRLQALSARESLDKVVQQFHGH